MTDDAVTPETAPAANAESADQATEPAVEAPAEAPAEATAAETAPVAVEPVAAEPVAAEPVAAEPVAEVFVRPTDYSARNPLWTLGRRKSSSARVRTFPGGGNFMINGKPLDEYFSHVADRHTATAALDQAGVRREYDIWVNVHGGGTSGQAGAVALGVARAVIVLAPETERALRDNGLLSRDARIKERKKYGRRGARRGFQFSKR